MKIIILTLLLSLPIQETKCVISGLLYNTDKEEGIFIERNECEIRAEIRNDYILIWDRAITMRARIEEYKGWVRFLYTWERRYIIIDNKEYHMYISDIHGS